MKEKLVMASEVTLISGFQKVIIKVLFLIVILDVGCHSGSRRVNYDEFQKNQIFTIDNSKIRIEYTNSIKNSALGIYKFQVIKANGIVLVIAYQSLGSPYNKYFEYNLSDFGISDFECKRLRWFWENEDKSQIEIYPILLH